MNRYMLGTHTLGLEDQNSSLIAMKFDQLLGMFHFFILFILFQTYAPDICVITKFCRYLLDRIASGTNNPSEINAEELHKEVLGFVLDNVKISKVF